MSSHLFHKMYFFSMHIIFAHTFSDMCIAPFPRRGHSCSHFFCHEFQATDEPYTAIDRTLSPYKSRTWKRMWDTETGKWYEERKNLSSREKWKKWERYNNVSRYLLTRGERNRKWNVNSKGKIVLPFLASFFFPCLQETFWSSKELTAHERWS